MRRVLAIVVAGMWWISVAVLGAPGAQAAGDAITRFDVVARVDAAGVMTVTQTIDVTFAAPGTGPTLWFPTRMSYDAGVDRLFTYQDISVTSPTAAPTQTKTSRRAAALEVRVGDAARPVSGTQTYVVEYALRGLLSPPVAGSGQDELSWNLIGTDWDLPISNLSVMIVGPGDVVLTRCVVSDSNQVCPSSWSGPAATFSQPSLSPGVPLRVAASWPTGTFDAQPRLVPAGVNPFSLVGPGLWWAAGSVGGIALALLAVAAVRRASRGQPSGGTGAGSLAPAGGPAQPGAGPAGGQETAGQPGLGAAAPLLPPPGIPPRLVGASLRQRSTVADLTATIIDLAVHGYITINRGPGPVLTLRPTASARHGLDAVESTIMDALFPHGRSLTRTLLQAPGFAATSQRLRAALASEYAARPAFTARPPRLRVGYLIAGCLIGVLGTAGAVGVGWWAARSGQVGIGWLALPCLVLGIGLALSARRRPVDALDSSAAATTALAFKNRLASAEADDLPGQPGQDIFSEYLPYAVAFGYTERWTELFDVLAEQGEPAPRPSWYQVASKTDQAVWGAIGATVEVLGAALSPAQPDGADAAGDAPAPAVATVADSAGRDGAADADTW